MTGRATQRILLDEMRKNQPRPRLAPQVEMRTGLPGVVEMPALSEHRLTIHAGPPAKVCSALPRYERGDIDILPAGYSAVWVEEETNTSLVIDLPAPLLRMAAEEPAPRCREVGLEPRSKLRDPQIEHIAWALEAEWKAGHPNGAIYMESLGMALAVHLLGRYAAPLETSRGLSKRQLQRMTDYIEEHLDQDLSLLRLAKVANMSASHLKASFKYTMGLPVHRYVVQRRVERAKVLLLRGEQTASEIALAAGFAHQSHMTLWMRRLLGVTSKSLMAAARAR